MGDRVAVLKDGFLQQVDAPQHLYDNPINVFVAAFIGSPSMNLYDATRQRRRRSRHGSVGAQTVAFGARDVGQVPQPAASSAVSGSILGIRPEDFEDAASPMTRRRIGGSGPGEAGRGARFGADGALRPRRRQDGRTPATPTHPSRSSVKASPTPSPASAPAPRCTPTTPWRSQSTPTTCTSSTPRRASGCSRRAEGAGRQPFTEPARIPRTKKRCSRKNTASGTKPG